MLQFYVEHPITAIASHPIHKIIVACTNDGRINFYSIKELKNYGNMILSKEEYVTCINFSKDGTALILATNTGKVSIIESLNWEKF